MTCQCPGAAMANCHMRGGLTNRNVLSPSSGGRSSRGEIQVLAGPGSFLRRLGEEPSRLFQVLGASCIPCVRLHHPGICRCQGEKPITHTHGRRKERPGDVQPARLEHLLNGSAHASSDILLSGQTKNTSGLKTFPYGPCEKVELT